MGDSHHTNSSQSICHKLYNSHKKYRVNFWSSFQWCKGKCDPLQSGWNSKSKHDKYFRIFQSAAYWDSSAHGWQRSQIYWWSPSMVTQSLERMPKSIQKVLNFQCAYLFCKICSIPARMRGFLIPSTHVWGFTFQLNLVSGRLFSGDG